MLRRTSSKLFMSFVLMVLLVTASANPLAAQPFVGCPSKEIQTAFNDFASVGKPPPDAWRSWQRDPNAQYIEPWKASEVSWSKDQEPSVRISFLGA
jgi:metallo-beta-lactamase class B